MINLFMIINTLVNSVVNCEISAIVFSDHGTVELHVDLNTDQIKWARWRLNTMLLKDKSFSDTISEDLKFFFETNIGSTEKYLVLEHLRHSYEGKSLPSLQS